MPITRRTCLGHASAAFAASLELIPRHLGAAPPEATLQAAAVARGLRYGALADTNLGAALPSYRDLFRQQCSLCAVDIWAPAYNPAPDTFNFATSEDAGIQAASALDIPITGAHLLWAWRTPDWFAEVNGRAKAIEAVRSYAGAIAAHYRGKAWSWNAVNEALNPPDGQPLGLRRCWPMQQIGPDYIDITFRAARNADPAAVLAYNDSDFELATRAGEARRGALMGLLDDLKRRGTPIDAVGLQSHLRYDEFARFDPKRYRAFLGEIAARGLKIIVTELDVLDIGAPSDITQRDAAVAEVYGRFLRVALDEPAVKAVVSWGLSDHYSWLNARDDPKFIRADALPARPLPFDDALQPTLAYHAIESAFRAAPKRTMQ